MANYRAKKSRGSGSGAPERMTGAHSRNLILQDELAGEGRIAIERYGGAMALLLAGKARAASAGWISLGYTLAT